MSYQISPRFKKYLEETSIFAGILIIVTSLIARSVLQSITLNKESNALEIFLVKVLSEYTNEFILGGFILIAVGLLTKSLTKRVSELWKTEISKELSNEITSASDRTRELVAYRTVDEVVASADVPAEALSKQLPNIYSKIYGDHCGNEESLLAAVQKKHSNFYDSKIPHRSDYHQTVTVKNHNTETIVWQEVCSYKLHTVALDPKYTPENKSPSDVIHLLRYVSVASVTELDSFHLEISVKHGNEGNSISIFDSRKSLLIDDNQVSIKPGFEEHINITQEGDELYLAFEQDIQLVDPWTHVEIKEHSIIRDDYMLSRRNEPTCRAKINISLPTNWKFELIMFGHPNDWTIHQYPPSTLSAWTNDWILPGITFYCKWNRPKDGT
jgi:hypothetical protein